MTHHAKPPLPHVLCNVASLHIGWFSSVLGAAHGMIWLGPVVVAGLVVVHLTLVEARQREVATLAAAALFGYLLDSTMVLAGVFDFPPQAQFGAPSTVWMVALWVNFAMGLNVALHWLLRRYGLAVILGAIGGPMAYWGGIRFGGLLAPAGLGVLIAAVAVQWAIATPLVVAGAARIGRWARQPVPGDAARAAS